MTSRQGALACALVLLAGLGLAGCAGHAPTAPPVDEQPVEPSGAASASSTGTLPPPAPAPPDNRFLEPVRADKFLANGCVGWNTGAPWPGLDPPPANPPTWEPATPGATMVLMEWVECQRINFGGLERGPVAMVFDYRHNVAFPEECWKVDRTTDMSSLYSWGVSDEALSRLLAERLGAPTYVLDSQWDSTAAGAATLSTFTWSARGEAPSTLQIAHGVGGEPAHRIPERFWWQNGTGVVALDLTREALTNAYLNRPSLGTLEPPMALAAAYPEYAAQAQWFWDQSMDGTLYSWSDLECKRPSGSSPPS